MELGNRRKIFNTVDHTELPSAITSGLSTSVSSTSMSVDTSSRTVQNTTSFQTSVQTRLYIFCHTTIHICVCVDSTLILYDYSKIAFDPYSQTVIDERVSLLPNLLR